MVAKTMAEKPQDEKEKYIEYRKLAGIEVLLETDQQKHDFEVEFNRWKAQGSPKPEMPKMEETPIPMKLYRIKYRGIQKIFWRDTKGVMHDKIVTKIPVKKTVKDAVTKQDIEIIERYEQSPPNYTKDYTKEIGVTMVEDALARCSNPTFYIIAGPDKILVGPKEFTEDNFDVLVDKIRKAARRLT